MLMFALVSLVAFQSQGGIVAVQDTTLQRGSVLKLYEVRDIATSMPADFPAPEIGVPQEPPRSKPAESARTDERGAFAVRQPAAGAPAQDAVAAAGRTLAELVKTFVQPPLADPTESVRCTDMATMVVNATAAQHEWIARFLATLRDFGGLIEIQTTIYETPRGLLQGWGLAPSATLATAADLEALKKRFAAEQRVEVLNAPQLTVLPCQRANISVLDQIAYIKDWQLQIVEPGRQEIADPEIAVIQAGLVVDARCSPVAAGTFALQLEVASCEVERPIPTKKVRISATNAAEVEIGQPKVHTARFAATVLLADGASVVLVCAGTDPDRDLAVVVTARKVAQHETAPEDK